MSSSGPYLYDDDPAPLHTGTPRRRQGLLIAILAGTALVAVGMVAALFLVKGSPEEQAQEVAGVFLSALEQGDDETAHQLLCQAERGNLSPAGVGPTYLAETPGRVVGSDAAPGGKLRVEVSWADGTTSEWTVISESGPRVCGTTGPRCPDRSSRPRRRGRIPRARCPVICVTDSGLAQVAFVRHDQRHRIDGTFRTSCRRGVVVPR